jgi:hypothetical protein
MRRNVALAKGVVEGMTSEESDLSESESERGSVGSTYVLKTENQD